MGPNSHGGKKNKVDAAKVSSARGRFSKSEFPGGNKPKKRGGRGHGRGANPADSSGRGTAGGGRAGGAEGGRATDAVVVQRLSERVTSGATSGVGIGGGGGGRDPLKGVDVAGLEEISIAEEDWQSVFRLLKDIGVFDSAGLDGKSDTPSSSNPGPPAPPGTTTSSGNPRGTVTTTAEANGGAPSSQPTSGLATAVSSAYGTTATPVALFSSDRHTPPTLGEGREQQQQRPDPAIMAYLTKFLAFPEADAATALSNTSGNDLAEALDYLCLHTDEAGLKRGFRRSSERGGGAEVRKVGGGGRGGGGGRKVLGASAGSSVIEVASSPNWKVEHRVLSLVKMGFKREEAEDALFLPPSSGCVCGEVREVMEHETLTRLLEPLRPPGSGSGAGSAEACRRAEEELVLSSIYGEEAFRVVTESAGVVLRWEVDTALEFEGGGISAESTVLVLFQKGKRYPFEAPLVLVVNNSLPPGLARMLIEAANVHAAALAGPDPIVHALVAWLQGASKACHGKFLAAVRQKEEQAAAEKKERAALARAGNRKGSKSSRQQQHQQEQQQQQQQAVGTADTSSSSPSPTISRSSSAAILSSRVERTLERQQKAKAEEEALRGRGEEWDQEEWRVEYLKSLNAGLDSQEAKHAADKATGRKATKAPSSAATNTRKPSQKSSPAAPDALKKIPTTPVGNEKAVTSAAIRKLHLALTADGAGEGAGGSSGVGGGEGMALAMADGYRPSPYLQEVMEVVQNTKASQPWLEAQEAKSLPLPPLAHAAEQVMRTQQQQQQQQQRQHHPSGKGHRFGDSTNNNICGNDDGGGGEADEAERLRAREKALSDSLFREFDKKQRTRSYQDMLAKRSKLPAFEMREHIVNTVRNAQVVVVSGETGCGKTTQVPQLVLDTMIMEKEGASANIIVTQPRRISAVGVAERIAAERAERIGETAGYQIRLESKRSKATRLLLCTTGILLRRLQVDPWLASVSHVFVDEVHERDLDTDFLLIILKGLLAKRPGLKLVLMSATLNADMFSDFFGGAPVVEIPGRAHPVTPFFLEDVLERTGYIVDPRGDFAFKGSKGAGGGGGGGRGMGGGGGGRSDGGAGGATPGAGERPTIVEIKKRYSGFSDHVHQSLLVMDESVINYEAISSLLEYITFNFEEGAILVFLPGLAEITKMLEALADNPLFNDKDKTRVYPLHGSLSTTDQKAIFEVPPKGVRKIVVSTNIAETSITIEDCVFVVDSCRVKENRFDDSNMMPMLLECWVSKASAKQRRGRAGRVRPGVCFHMCSSGTFEDTLSDFQLPEMLRVSLDDMVLQILLLDKGDPAKFLASAVNPPTELAVSNSIKYLCELQATQLDENDQPVLTALGFHLATLPVEPRVGKMMLYGAILGCVEPAITIAATMSCRNPFVAPFEKRDIADEARRSFALALSDHLTLLKAYDGWRLARGCGSRAEREYLRDHFLSRQTLVMVEDMRRQFRGLLRDIGFIEGGGGGGGGGGNRYSRGNSGGFGDTKQQEQQHHHSSNVNGGNIQLIKAVVCAGLYPNVIVAPAALCPTSTPALASAGAAASGAGGKKPGGGGSKGGSRGGVEKTAGEVSLEGRKGAMFLHPMTVNFDKKELDSRFGVYHEVVKTTKVYIRDMTTVTPLMLALFGGSLQVHHERQAITVDKWLHFRAARRAATLVKYLRVHMERLLLRKITHPQEDISDNGRDLIQSVSTLLTSGARRAGVQQDYSSEMLAAEINGVRQGAKGADGWGGGGFGWQQQQRQQHEQMVASEADRKHLRVLQRREQEDAVRRSAVPAGGNESYHRSSGGGGSVNRSGGAAVSTPRDTTGGGVSEEELLTPLLTGLPSTDTPVRIPTVIVRTSTDSSINGGGGAGGGGSGGGSGRGSGREQRGRANNRGRGGRNGGRGLGGGRRGGRR